MRARKGKGLTHLTKWGKAKKGGKKRRKRAHSTLLQTKKAKDRLQSILWRI